MFSSGWFTVCNNVPMLCDPTRGYTPVKVYFSYRKSFMIYDSNTKIIYVTVCCFIVSTLIYRSGERLNRVLLPSTLSTTSH